MNSRKMVRFKPFSGFSVFIFVFVSATFLNPISCNGENIATENDTVRTNVMRISGSQLRPRSLLKYNTNQMKSKRNISDVFENGATYIPYDLQIVVEALSKLNYSQCLMDAKTVLESISRRERWALKVFDASSKFPVGILHGAFYQLGNFDECIEVRQPGVPNPVNAITGQYCLADVELYKGREDDARVARSFEGPKPRSRWMFNSTIHWGICVPASCTPHEVEVVVREIFTMATDHPGITVTVATDRCHYSKQIPWSVLEIVYGSVVGIFIMFTFFATAFHYFTLRQRRKTATSYTVEAAREQNNNNDSSQGTAKKIVLCFSTIHTVTKFLHTKPSELNLECVCGIKFISMLFIVAGHSMVYLIGGPVMNTSFIEEESSSFPNAIFLNSPLMVDTFLLISGFLMCYLLLIELEKRKGQVNFLVLYIARYIRLTPSYLVIIGFYCTLLYRMGDGPLWDSRIGLERDRCLESWWTNLLYINNYVNTDSLCMFQSWYLAADYHLFIIAPFLIYPLWRWPKIGKALLILCTVAFTLVPFVITLKDKLDPTLMVYSPESYDLSKNFYFVNVYIKTHIRASSYFLGLVCGYLVYKLQTSGTKIPWYVIWLGWCLSAVCGILSMFSVVVFFYPNHEYNAFEAAIYASLHRVAWCIAIGWVLVACITDNAALVNKFLSWKFFIPLSRLTYCAYLVNGFVEIYSLGTIRAGTYMSKFGVASHTLSQMVLTFSIAFVLCIFFESPIHGIEKILLQKDKTRQQNHRVGPTTPQPVNVASD